MDEKIGLFSKEFKEKLSLDTRFTVFEVKEIWRKESILIGVVCSEKQLGKAIRKFFKLYFDNSPVMKLKLKFLPDEALLHKFGIGNAGVSPMYSQPSNKVEQVSQVVFGEAFDVLEVSSDEEWYRIRLHKDGYLGWVNKNPIVLLDNKQLTKYYRTEKVEIVKKFADVFALPDKESPVLRGIFLGAELSAHEQKKEWIKVTLPDGSTGWLNEKNCRKAEKDFDNPKDLLKFAKMLLGVPYIWGGRSPFGIDCSSYTQLIYKMCGYQLPRDCSLQIKSGIDAGTDFKKLVMGDLLFFKNAEGRAVHVAMYTGKDMDFIHASGFVKINSLNKKSKLFDDRLSKMFFGARRIINL
jgi:gamma-D-glutamyl-L-lysine dipeptidyl-peptidase